MIGFIPISMTFAMLALQSGLSTAQTDIMSVFVLAGASQMMAVKMLALGAGVFEIVLATFILNLRHLIMSVYVNNRLKNTPSAIRMILSFGITDETFAILSTAPDELCNEYYFAGLAGISYASWIAGTLMGSVLVQILPPLLVNSMSVSLYAMFIGLLLPNIKKSPRIGVIVLAGILLNVILGSFLSGGWAIVISTVASAYLGTYFIDEAKAEPANG
jgi:4-azaleucine resistance transporter AzlC